MKLAKRKQQEARLLVQGTQEFVLHCAACAVSLDGRRATNCNAKLPNAILYALPASGFSAQVLRCRNEGCDEMRIAVK